MSLLASFDTCTLVAGGQGVYQCTPVLDQPVGVAFCETLANKTVRCYQDTIPGSCEDRLSQLFRVDKRLKDLNPGWGSLKRVQLIRDLGGLTEFCKLPELKLDNPYEVDPNKMTASFMRTIDSLGYPGVAYRYCEKQSGPCRFWNTRKAEAYSVRDECDWRQEDEWDLWGSIGSRCKADSRWVKSLAEFFSKGELWFGPDNDKRRVVLG